MPYLKSTFFTRPLVRNAPIPTLLLGLELQSPVD